VSKMHAVWYRKRIKSCLSGPIVMHLSISEGLIHQSSSFLPSSAKKISFPQQCQRNKNLIILDI